MSGGSSKSESDSQQQSQQQIDPTQLAFLRNLWSHASQFAGSGQGNVNGTQANDFLDTMQNNPYAQGVQQFSQPNNQMVQGQVDLLGQNLQRQFSNQLMPAIGSNAQAAGQYGGGRQGVAQGLAAQGIQQAFAQGASGIQNNAYNQAAGMTQFGAQNALQGAGMGMQGLGQLQQMQFAPYMTLAQILGGPTVLGSSSGNSNSNSSSMNFGVKA